MSLQGSSVFYLKSLAIADTVNCLSGIFGRELMLLSRGFPFGKVKYSPSYQNYYLHYYSVVDTIFQLTTNTSAWLLFAMSLDRYIAIRNPLSAKKLCTLKSARGVSAMVFILTILFDIPTYWDVEMFREKPGEKCSFVRQRLLLLKNKDYSLWYDFFFGKVVISVIPGTVVIICNIHMLFLLRRSFKDRQKLTQDKDPKNTNSSQGLQITITILVLNCVYFMEYVLGLINTIIPAIPNVKIRPFHSGQLIHAINAMINMFVYLGIRRGFAKTLIWCLTCGRAGKRL
ncbi:FMRFamide receptor-like [Tubulanus polymorphus]|uniref:FMRFamide receptor-like n=1 Tax=Tubulanus polymorphus TaxID=672921 RepID=UPI003DA6ABD5